MNKLNNEMRELTIVELDQVAGAGDNSTVTKTTVVPVTKGTESPVQVALSAAGAMLGTGHF